ncbi:MAG: rod shape-determining protein MreC, partial [Clostridiales bacterium]|nr:rod shape-determining protein MreC [Clostridiales bacterium]
SKFLPGITIGYVKDVKVESSNLEKSAKLEPVVDFKHLREVFVIKELKEQPKLN